MNRQYAFSRNFEGECVVVTVNNDDSDFTMTLPCGNAPEYIGALSGQKVSAANGSICVNVKANSGDIWLPLTGDDAAKAATPAPVELHVDDAAKNASVPAAEPVQTVSEPVSQNAPAQADDAPKAAPASVPAKETPVADAAYTEAFEKGKIAGLQEAIIAIMEKNGNVTDQMRKDVTDNVYHDSLINWIKSFR